MKRGHIWGNEKDTFKNGIWENEKVFHDVPHRKSVVSPGASSSAPCTYSEWEKLRESPKCDGNNDRQYIVIHYVHLRGKDRLEAVRWCEEGRMSPNSASEGRSMESNEIGGHCSSTLSNGPERVGVEQGSPFSNEIHLKLMDKIALALGTLFLVPIRGLLVLASLGLGWLVAKIGLYGLTGEDIEGRARKGWRRTLLSYYGIIAKMVFWSAGFQISVKGEQASRSEAPILFQGMRIDMPILISSIQLFFQTIFVDRRKSDSRKETMEMIRKRSLDPDNDYTQLFLCPEGTNTNRKVLIRFKVGAFAPGVPVQPVLIRYPGYDRIDAITWTYNQSHSYAYSVWLLLARPINRVEVEFLPVYHPSQEEKDSAELYAKNVQKIMANKLGIRATDITYSKYYEEYVNGYELQNSTNNNSSSMKKEI
ncbi:LPCAT1_2 [Lepeophtheirus salmonis]|uniref:LPCAT1_2 n=1 Tax=Lepeophtheirus salmonis TaxID=72036 RepID=A0A7R8CZX3_LEPSM|nr:LPCAT1_2 [Lepeophtheirus salmonis]CAF2978970.1 LPCAT1_2 [Lepeophtheirus salmonis]